MTAVVVGLVGRFIPRQPGPAAIVIGNVLVCLPFCNYIAATPIPFWTLCLTNNSGFEIPSIV